MLSTRLRSARKAKKITQDDLAKRVNTKKTTISNYETGYSSPSNEMLKDLADTLEVSVDYLLGRSNDPSLTGGNRTSIRREEREKRILEEFSKLTIEAQEKLLEIARLMAQGNDHINKS